MTPSKMVLLFTGHLIDSVERNTKRFDHAMIDDVRSLIRKSMDAMERIQPIGMAISSLGAGGDILFAEEVLQRNIPLHVFLPFEKERFISESVSYIKAASTNDEDNWLEKFERVLAGATEVHVINTTETDVIISGDDYARCNTVMLRAGLKNAGEARNMVALALVKPGEESIVGGAWHFIEEIKSEKIPVQIIWPSEQNLAEALKNISRIDQFIPVFKFLDGQASLYQGRWKKRLQLSVVILATIAFFDAFTTVPDHFLFNQGQAVRIFCLVVSAFGAFLTLQMQLSDKTSHSQWTRSRAKAEQIRSEIWFYLFNYWSENNRSGPYSETELQNYLENIRPSDWKGKLVQLNDLIYLKEAVQQLSVQERIDFYLQHRLDDQLNYFKRKKNYFTTRLRRYNATIVIFLTVSITWGALKIIAEYHSSLGFFLDMSPLGMMISFIALVSSYSEANNSKEMEYKYQQMSEGLEELRKGKDISELRGFDEWVKECETFLRTQNNEWSLKREMR